MSAIVVLVTVASGSLRAQSTTCSEDVTATLAEASTLIAKDAFGRAEALLAATHQQERGCRHLALAHFAVAGWNAARAAAARGGSAESLAAPRRILADLVVLAKQGSSRYETEYSGSLIAAAMAAAQDEREEMRVHLEQARWAHGLLTITAPRDLWPLPLDEAEGELWLEVDRFHEAAAAFRRAVAAGRDRAHAGLARSAVALGDTPTACESYRQWLAGKTEAPADRRQAAEDYVREKCSRDPTLDGNRQEHVALAQFHHVRR